MATEFLNTPQAKEAKKCFAEVKHLWDKLTGAYDIKIIKWAFNRKLNWEREKTSLAKEKAKLEERLAEVEKELK